MSDSSSLASVVPTLSNRAYDWLKFVALILLPASGTLYFTLGGVWEWPNVTEIIGTITAVDTFLGVVLGLTSKAYNETKPPALASANDIDGVIYVEDVGDGLMMKLQPNKNPVAMAQQPFLTFKTAQIQSKPEETA